LASPPWAAITFDTLQFKLAFGLLQHERRHFSRRVALDEHAVSIGQRGRGEAVFLLFDECVSWLARHDEHGLAVSDRDVDCKASALIFAKRFFQRAVVFRERFRVGFRRCGCIGGFTFAQDDVAMRLFQEGFRFALIVFDRAEGDEEIAGRVSQKLVTTTTNVFERVRGLARHGQH
jgi:hypothetical protein